MRTSNATECHLSWKATLFPVGPVYRVVKIVESAQLARSERFELPALGIEIRCSIQLSYERASRSITRLVPIGPAACDQQAGAARCAAAKGAG
jgi:hypothetical protein